MGEQFELLETTGLMIPACLNQLSPYLIIQMCILL